MEHIKIRWKDPELEKMDLIRGEAAPYLSWAALREIPGILHGFSTRLGGVSSGCLSAMNLSFSRGDVDENVRENFRRIGLSIGFSPEDMVMSDQTHTANVRLVTAKDRGSGYTRKKDFHDVDGMITREPGVVLATFYADCVPLFFVDPVRRAIGLSHSGWRGTAQKIGAVTVKKMQEEFGCDPKDLVAAIGPSICRDCYEVSEDVIEAFCGIFPEELHSTLWYRKPDGKYQLDLWEANRQILKESGIPDANIHLPNLCTCCNPDFLFSHRASRGKRGNLAAFLAISDASSCS